MNEALIIIALICIILVINFSVLLGVRRRRSSTSGKGHHNSQPASSRSNAYLIANRYYLISPAHKQGGMATIWLAAERKTGRQCIIKTPRRGTKMDNVYLDKLLLEAGYLKSLKHAGIVKYLNDFYYEGEYHLVIEYLDGETLMAASPRYPFTEQQVIAWAGQILEALSYIHTVGIIHRDVNPKNIMLCSNNTVKLIDFGTARDLHDTEKDKVSHDPFTQITNKGFDIPELFTGDNSDQRCDICGLAQTCIYLLTMENPNEICLNLFKSNWPRSYGEASALADYMISNRMSKRTARCLAQGIMFSPDNRFADAAAFKAALSSADGYPLKADKAVKKK